MNPNAIERNQSAQLGASIYLLHALLEQAERQQGGFVRATIERVLKDHAGIPGDAPDKPFVDAVFSEILDMLRRADPAGALPEMPPAPRPRAAVAAGLSRDWRQWIAESRLRECTPESMLETMKTAGLDAAEAEAAIAAMENEPAFLAARRMQQVQRKLESVTANLQKLWASAPRYDVVEKRSSPSREEFIERYVRGCRPVVLTDVARDWPAMQRWSPEDLKQRFGRFDVEIQDGRDADPNYEENKLAHRRVVPLGPFVDRVLAGGPTNDYYLTANNEVLRGEAFSPLLADIGSLPPACDRSQLADRSSFWFGPAGTKTPLHHDTIMLFHTQVVGRKRWRLVSPLETPKLYNFNGVFSPVDIDDPDLGRYPLFKEVTILDVVVEPGETMFLPLAWWHQVVSLDLSMSLSYSNLDVPNDFSYRNPDIRNW
ncbi:Cupin-like domain-containing protein [Variovorax sp. HW608]|uniref:cupin-like domain-containing protein n=1 Tax=Variovorax sp. HW608 TaxID=1034889 RepID=UPI00081FB257|nr:cupin-like domain-containing protein [Variovorax sp. HW608]SCK51732.1 Cupin-like domain-containing protein [Variovorax sp. HW608]